MAISTNGTIITRLAGALYGEYLSNASYTELSTTAPATVAANFLSNDFASKTDLQIANTMLTNLGLTSITGLNNWLAAQLTAAGSTPAAKGAKIVSILNDYSQMASDATYGTYATSFNAKTAASLTLSQTSSNLGGSFSTADSVSISGQTFTLTTGTNKFTGTIADDTFDAGISSSSLQTLNSGDCLDGGAGSDALFAVVTGSVTPSALKSIEVVNITNTTTAATVDLSNATGLTAVTNQASTIGLTLAGISKSGPTVTIRDTAVSGQTVTFNDVTGSADAATVVINNLTSGSSLTVAGVETLTLVSDGSATNALGSSTVTGLVAAAATTLKVTGSQGLTFSTSAIPATVTTLDASGNTSTLVGVTAVMGATTSNTIVGGAGNDSFTIVSTGNDSVNAGAGTDTVWYSTGTWTQTDTVDGGAGTADTLRVLATSAAGLAIPTTYNTTNIERVQITDALAAATYTPANISATATTLNVTGNTSGAGVTITTGAALSAGNPVIVGPAGAFTVGLGTSLATNTLGILANAATLTINDTGTAINDSVTVTNNAMQTSGSMLNVWNSQVLAFNGYETVTLNTGSTSGATNAFGTITVTGDAGGTSAETVNFSGINIVTAGVITADVVDASGLTAAGTAAAPTITMVTGSTATTVTGSSGIDILFGNTATASSITAGAGNDTMTGGTGNDTILGGDGNDQITAGSGNDSIDAGAGNDTIVMAANLASGDVINGGDGTDVLLVSAAIAASAAATVSNVEVIGFSATSTQDMTAFLNSGITTLAATAGALTVTNAQANLSSIVLGASGASAVTGANLTRLVDSTADSLSILLVDGTTGGTTLVTPSLANEETLTIGESGTDSTAAVTFALGTVTATSLKTLNITGSNNHTMTLSGNTALATINASAATGTLNITDGNSAVNETITGPAASAMTVTGGSGNDSITGGAAADSMVGGAGNDTILGNAGNDTIIGGLGVDSLVGGDGTDTISAAYTLSTDGGSTLATGVVINLGSTAITAATIAGFKTTGAGTVVLGVNSDLSTVASGTMVNLGTSANVATTSARVDTLSGFENIIGSTGTDYLVGSSSANTITGGTGADVVLLGAGADTYVFVQADSIAQTGTTDADAAFAAGETVTFANGVDVIRSGFTAGTGGDVLDLDVTAAIPTTGIGANNAALTTNTVYVLSGAYVASTGVFTIAAAGTGADTLMYVALAASAVSLDVTTSTSAIVLVGVVDTALVAANFA